jgi:tRNA dimethylallyltransferase
VTRHLALIGTTATGKSACALELARKLGDIEIVSLDSMQVYREMDIGTAKPTAAERAEVAHHLIDVADPDDEWSVRETQHAARTALDAIAARGNRAVFVGGTGLYVRAVVDALDVPPNDTAKRAELEARVADGVDLGAAYAELQRIDPLAASRIEPDNRRRIVRALEVFELTGRPFSSYGPGLTAYGPPAIDVALIGLELHGDVLSDRIAMRFAAMRDAGLVDEVRALSTRAGGLSRTARQAIGYRELLAFLDGRLDSLTAALELAELRTRQLARRQRAWFRRDPRIQWIDAEPKSASVAAEVMARWLTPTAATPIESRS